MNKAIVIVCILSVIALNGCIELPERGTDDPWWITLPKAPNGVEGDINGDMVIDLLDAQYLAQFIYGTEGFEDPQAYPDVNCDGVLNEDDITHYQDWRNGWAQIYPGC